MQALAQFSPAPKLSAEEPNALRLLSAQQRSHRQARPLVGESREYLEQLTLLTFLAGITQTIRLVPSIEGAPQIGVTPAEIMEVFAQVMLYGGYVATRTVMQVASSVFTELGLTEEGSTYPPISPFVQPILPVPCARVWLDFARSLK